MDDINFENWLKEVQQYGVRYLGCDDKPLTPKLWRASFDAGLTPEAAVVAAYRHAVENKHGKQHWPQQPCADGRVS